jgi:hypothetical protein
MEPTRTDIQHLTKAVRELTKSVNQLKSVLATGVLMLSDESEKELKSE